MRRRDLILAGAALVVLALGMGLGHALARATGSRVETGLEAGGQLQSAAGLGAASSSVVPASVAPAPQDAPASTAGATTVPAPAATAASGASAGGTAVVVIDSTTTSRPASTTTVTEAPSTTATTRPPASTATPATASPAPAAGLNRMEQGVLDAVNAARQMAGCPALTVDSSLQAAAHAYAALMVSEHWFDHRSPNGQSPTDRARAAGYQGGVGENLMMGFKGDPTGAVTNAQYGWLQSDGHRANILNCDYRRTGVGYDPGNIQSGYADGSWVQMFG